MAQTNLDLARLRNYVTAAMSDGAVHSSLDRDELINNAGRLFFSLHEWNFRYRPQVDLDLTADQKYIVLPEDFGELVGYQTDSTYGLMLTTPQEVANLRAASTTVTANYYWATIVHPAQSARDEPPPPPRLEIWPTPSSGTTTHPIHLWYRAAWVDLYNSTDVADVPRYAHMALIQVVRAFAAGINENLLAPGGGLEGYLDNVLGGRVWEAAVTTDGLQQPDYGPIGPGAIEGTRVYTTWRSRTASAVSDPA
jgi:hypothetical protein